MNFQIRQNTASVKDIESHLMRCDNNFIPPLHETINISAYADKIKQYADTFEVWDKEILVSLLAAYINDPKRENAYITNVSVENNYQRKGISVQLVQACIEYVTEQKFHQILLEVNKENYAAIQLYTKFGFSLLSTKNNSIFMHCKLKK